MLVTLGDRTIDEQVENALHIMNKPKQLDGLILDNRQNEGGADDVLISTLSYFTEGTMGFFTSRDKERPLYIEGRDIAGSQKIPLVLLIGIDTVSYGEIMSGVLKDNGRAYLIGETTAGNVETLWGYEFPDGSRAWIAHESFRPYNHPEDDWEANGIIPHRMAITNWDEITINHDPAVIAALSYLDSK
jgi:C-terminal processing protease CtpA/Prc